MIELFCAFLLGLVTGYFSAPRDRDFKEQHKIYADKLQEMQGNIDFYKKWCKQISEENAEFRREVANLKQWEQRQLDVIDSLNTQIKHLESQVYGGSTK